MRYRLLTKAVALLAVALPAPPVAALDAELGVSGNITVYADLGACGSLTFRRPTAAVGALTGAGAVAGPGTATAPVRGATPIAVTGATSWYGCLPDAYAGATAGYATYLLSATTPDGEYVSAVTCVVRAGAVTCR